MLNIDRIINNRLKLIVKVLINKVGYLLNDIEGC